MFMSGSWIHGRRAVNGGNKAFHIRSPDLVPGNHRFSFNV